MVTLSSVSSTEAAGSVVSWVLRRARKLHLMSFSSDYTNKHTQQSLECSKSLHCVYTEYEMQPTTKNGYHELLSLPCCFCSHECSCLLISGGSSQSAMRAPAPPVGSAQCHLLGNLHSPQGQWRQSRIKNCYFSLTSRNFYLFIYRIIWNVFTWLYSNLRNKVVELGTWSIFFFFLVAKGTFFTPMVLHSFK